MELTDSTLRLLQWISSREPVLGMFHVMTDIRPLIAEGLIEMETIVPSQRKLRITEAGRARLEATAVT
jgi:hypothetical protein